MSNIQSTVIMKTDLANFTTKVSQSSQSDLLSLLNTHKELVTNVVSKNSGKIIKGEGDSFWVTFPSVTIAAVSAVEIQQEFRTAQAGLSDDETLQIRIAVTIGDVLHQEGDIFGDAVNLAARIEAITPPDEIYLSHAAWLVLNKTEVSNSFVRQFELKGINEQERIYKVDQRYKTRILRNQIVIITDSRKFTYFKDKYAIDDVEKLLTEMENVARESCESYGGTIRQTIGDSHFMTFTEPIAAIKANMQLMIQWDSFLTAEKYPCYMTTGMHRADVYIFRSCIHGDQINKAATLQSMCNTLDPKATRNVSLISEDIYNEVKDSDLASNFNKIEAAKIGHDPKQINTYFKPGENIYELVL